ncbi:MAG TPA: winged helix-turn-helix domain-containing protein [Pyrinomonadaceae bacterium]|nr:winged helix-turn-helix domain-containing protein [Pyrinomonadaceae bacterium]
MSEQDVGRRLDFACECVSSHGGYGDPWAGLAQRKLLSNGTKEEILCSVARDPKTIAQLARELSLSPPSVFTHVTELVSSDLIRAADGHPKRHPSERYYEPNFPVVRRAERAEFDSVCEELSEQFAALFARRLKRLEHAFDGTDLAARGWKFEDVGHYLYARVQRGARERLEDSGALPPRQPHLNGSEWVFWAEESEAPPDPEG